ncbi:alpha/beta hydrolase [Allorhizocola rhizosphaerae]|uniref:alpha/beta hydrolase n=1 Tax=Allorhizocola rhizosphaerae TaxID=1872709 RepID=UPI0013C2E3EF|nr:alpha/beta hydrolase [Allorhizocola rhizosphaerae]
MKRNRLLAAVAALSTLAVMLACTKENIEAVLGTCPSSFEEGGGISWTPDVGRPVFWGMQDLTVAAGAPRDMQIFYPTFEGFTNAPPILKQCLTRWPVVHFLHGDPPVGVQNPGYHKKWFRFAISLARSGFVVVVPSHDARLPSNPDISAAEADLNFVRNQWSNSAWVAKQPELTAVAGHSYGALTAATIAGAHPEFGAFISLGGGFSELPNPIGTLQALRMPSLFMWAKREPQEDLDSGGQWNAVTANKYAATYEGRHFDYLHPADSGNAQRGPCELIGGTTGDLAALFIARNVRIPLSPTQVSVELTPPQVQLTFDQEFYAGNHLEQLRTMPHVSACKMDMRWIVDGATGARKVGS